MTCHQARNPFVNASALIQPPPSPHRISFAVTDEERERGVNAMCLDCRALFQHVTDSEYQRPCPGGTR